VAHTEKIRNFNPLFMLESMNRLAIICGEMSAQFPTPSKLRIETGVDEYFPACAKAF
jgi:hypothetical protein